MKPFKTKVKLQTETIFFNNFNILQCSENIERLNIEAGNFIYID